MSWTQGYVCEVEYPHGYYRELNPALLRIACASAGVAPPQCHRYLELGFGQGLSINIHAAANDAEFCGVDFNPAHVASARALAGASGAKPVLLDDSFLQFLNRPEAADFDYIGLHGTWTWISDENRRAILDIVTRRLKVGGIFYISYNCLPGWAAAMPLRHLIMMHAQLAGAEAAGLPDRIDAALKFAQQVADAGALYFRANPTVVEFLKTTSGQNRNYLAHEFFTRNWDVMPFSEVVRWLDDAKLTFVASAQLLDHVDAFHLTPDAQKLLAAIQHPVLRQSVRDYFVNPQFRRDIFVKGARRLNAVEQFELLQAAQFVLVAPPSSIPMKVTGTMREAALQESVYRPLIEALAENDLAPKRLAELADHPKLKPLQWPQLMQAVLVLIGMGTVDPAQQPHPSVRNRCAALNNHICRLARASDGVACLASPVTGGGVLFLRTQLLFLLAVSLGRTGSAAQGQYAFETLWPQGVRLRKDGKPLESAQENLSELTAQAELFNQKVLPLCKALALIP
jgi:SAM-dependent methyltransferase